MASQKQNYVDAPDYPMYARGLPGKKERRGVTSNDEYLAALSEKGRAPGATTGDKWKATERRLQPTAHGFIGALTDMPGMRLRKLGDTPAVVDPATGREVKPAHPGELVYDFYNPFTEDPRPDEYSSYAEQLDQKEGSGTGGLVNAATLIPTLMRSGARAVGSWAAKQRLGQASEQLAEEVGRTAEAANWASPHKLPAGEAAGELTRDAAGRATGVHTPGGGAPGTRPSGPAQLGQEAFDELNAAPGRREVAEAGVKAEARRLGEAANLGSEYDDIINAATKSQTVMRPIVGAASATYNSVGDSNKRPSTPPPSAMLDIGTLPTTEVDMGGEGAYTPTGVKQPSAAERIKQALAQGEGIPAYQKQPTNFMQKFADYLQPRAAQQTAREDEARYNNNEITRRSFVAPEAGANLQDVMNQLQAERGLTTAEAAANLPSARRAVTEDFTKSYAPAMDVTQVEKQFNLPAGSLDPALVKQLARNAPSALETIMAQMYEAAAAGRGGQPGAGGMPATNKVNPNRQIKRPE